jgi:integrase
VFRFQKSGRIYHLLRQVSDAAGVKIGHHMLRHTWATWMRRYGKLTREDLLDTGAWRDVQSIRRYDHADTSEAARAADLLPDVTASPNRKAG